MNKLNNKKTCVICQQSEPFVSFDSISHIDAACLDEYKGYKTKNTSGKNNTNECDNCNQNTGHLEKSVKFYYNFYSSGGLYDHVPDFYKQSAADNDLKKHTPNFIKAIYKKVFLSLSSPDCNHNLINSYNVRFQKIKNYILTGEFPHYYEMFCVTYLPILSDKLTLYSKDILNLNERALGVYVDNGANVGNVIVALHPQALVGVNLYKPELPCFCAPISEDLKNLLQIITVDKNNNVNFVQGSNIDKINIPII